MKPVSKSQRAAGIAIQNRYHHDNDPHIRTSGDRSGYVHPVAILIVDLGLYRSFRSICAITVK